MMRSAASDLGLHCLPISHKKDASPIWVNICDFLSVNKGVGGGGGLKK